MGNKGRLSVATVDPGDVVLPREPTEAFLQEVLTDLGDIEVDPDAESRRRSIDALRHEFRVRLAALRLEGDPVYHVRLDKVGRDMMAGDTSECVSADDVDKLFASYLGE